MPHSAWSIAFNDFFKWIASPKIVELFSSPPIRSNPRNPPELWARPGRCPCPPRPCPARPSCADSRQASAEPAKWEVTVNLELHDAIVENWTFHNFWLRSVYLLISSLLIWVYELRWRETSYLIKLSIQCSFCDERNPKILLKPANFSWLCGVHNIFNMAEAMLAMYRWQ